MTSDQKLNLPEFAQTANKGLENIIACTSEISTIHDTTLVYRGYTIEDLVEHCCFEEVIYLLWNKKLPQEQELVNFKKELSRNYLLPQKMFPLLEMVAKVPAHGMSHLRTAVSFMGQLDVEAEEIDEKSLYKKSILLTAAMGSIVATLARFQQGKTSIQPRADQSIAWNFLNQVTGKEPTLEEEKLFDVALILHADHELNASTFTSRVVASTTSDYYSAIVGALCSLKGPLHGGANEQVMLMLEEIKSINNVDSFIKNALENKKKIMGIGHRVYKNGDPRARILRQLSLDICKKSGLEEKHKILSTIEDKVLDEKGLMPNVDFYSGLVYTALGLKPRDFTPIFALSRIAGWSAQVMEQYQNNRIYRPRAYYVGPIDLSIQ